MLLKNPLWVTLILETASPLTLMVASNFMYGRQPCKINIEPFRTPYFVCQVQCLQEYWVITESRVPLKPVLRGVRIVALSISSHEQTQ